MDWAGVGRTDGRRQGRGPTAEARDLLLEWVRVSGERMLWPPGGCGATCALLRGEGPQGSSLPKERRRGQGAGENLPASGGHVGVWRTWHSEDEEAVVSWVCGGGARVSSSPEPRVGLCPNSGGAGARGLRTGAGLGRVGSLGK